MSIQFDVSDGISPLLTDKNRRLTSTTGGNFEKKKMKKLNRVINLNLIGLAFWERLHCVINQFDSETTTVMMVPESQNFHFILFWDFDLLVRSVRLRNS